MRFASVLLLLLLFASAGCHKVFEKPRWKTDMKAPLIKTSLTIGNIVRDTSMLRINADSSIKIVSHTGLYNSSISIDSFARLEVTPYHKNVKLSTLVLDTRVIYDTITLGQLAREMKKSGSNTAADIILDPNNQGKYILFPGVYNITAGPLDVDIQQFFEEAEIRTGTMEITLENKLPVDISNLQFDLKNKVGGEVITSQTFTNLNSHTSQTKTDDLAGKRAEGTLALNVIDMDVPSTGFTPIKIDTNDALIITLKVSGVTVSSATAVFPAQDVVNETSQIALEGIEDGMMLTKAKILEGEVEAYATSTAEDTVFFTYTINSATLNGAPFVMKVAVPPKAQNKHFTASFNGYDLDLRGKNNDTVNAFYSSIVGSIKYTGKKVHLALSDSFDVVVNINKFTPSYIEGYFGSKTINLGSGSYSMDLFKNIQSGTLNFEQVKASLAVENFLGLEGDFNVNSLTALNTKTGASQSITSPLSGTIAPAASKDPLAPSTSIQWLDGNDARNILNIIPDKFNYDITLSYNKSNTPPAYNAPSSAFTNFAYRDNYLTPNLDIEIPLSVIAKDLVLVDTTTFLSEDFKTSVNSGSFSVVADNGFPLGGDLVLYFLDGNKMAVDSVKASSGILPAQVDPVTHRVSAKTQSRVSFAVDNARMKTILTAREVVFRVSFSTVDAASDTPMKIYSDYALDFKLVGDFNYTVE